MSKAECELAKHQTSVISQTASEQRLCWLDGAVREDAWVPRVVARTVASVLGSSWIGLEFVVRATTTDLQRYLWRHLCFQGIYRFFLDGRYMYGIWIEDGFSCHRHMDTLNM
jgi:hypothetical protein